ncbi:acyl-CoA synthetase [Mycobacterium sp. SWH-M1]|nr:acyl-CoA synthetase [Mycobacterium sp. SWH-M1]
MTDQTCASARPHAVKCPIGTDVIDEFTAAAHEGPYRTAIVHNGDAVTYREIAQRVSEMAAACRLPRVAGADRIAALVSHTPSAATTLLGVLSAGLTYCPIDGSLPAERVRSMMSALGVDRVYSALQCDTVMPGVRVGQLHADVDPATSTPWQTRRSPDDAAYVLCTSGSTGTPKPVVVSRQALGVTVRALRALFELTPQDRVLQFASLGWDTCLEEILPALTAGAALVFDDRAHRGSFPIFLRAVAEQEISVIDLPTAFWHELVRFLDEENEVLPASVRLVVIGGEMVDPTRLRQWTQLGMDHVRLLNTYGCTETTLITHAVQLRGVGTEISVGASDDAPIGMALPHVVDHISEDGELLISGPGVASEYLGMPEQTASAFSFADHGCGPMRWFHTGDVVVRDDGGLLHARGRADEQLKVLGVRVHPAEVEAHLHSHPSVTASVVVGERTSAGKCLAAYVVARQPVTAKELKHYLARRLPKQFVPSRFTFVTALAYTQSGKVDRAATRRAVTDISEGVNS